MTTDELKQAAIATITTSLDEKMKNDAIVYLKNLLDTDIKEVAEAFADATRKQAADEHGWCAFRDRYFLPGMVKVSIDVLTAVLTKMLDASAKAQVPFEEAAAPAAEEKPVETAPVEEAPAATEVAAEGEIAQ